MRLIATGGVLVLLAATPALAQPAPAGSCRLDEGLVAQLPTLSPDSEAPHVLSMPVPKMGNAVVDVSFHIEADGTVANVKVLCVSSRDEALGVAIEKASKTWKFGPMKHAGKAIASDASYRISASGSVPLNILPEKLRPIEG